MTIDIRMFVYFRRAGFSLTLIAGLACCAMRTQADVILFEDFEDNTVTYTTTGGEFFESGNDLFTISPLNGVATPDDGPYSGFGGNNYFAAEDMNDSKGPGLSTQTLSFTVNITDISDLVFSGLFAAGNNVSGEYDGPDGLRIRAIIDGGVAQNLLAFEALGPSANNELRQDANFDGVGDAGGFLPTHMFSAFNSIPISGVGNSLLLEIELSFDGKDESIALDNILILGTPEPAIPEPSTAALLGLGIVVLCARRIRRGRFNH